MANVKLKSDFKDGEVLFGEQLNNNFKAIEAALAALNKVSWQDNLDEELVVFKGTTFEIENRSIVSGQILYDIEKDIVYLDVATGTNALDTVYQRINMSGGVKTITEGDLGNITEAGIYLIKTGANITDNKGSGETIEEIRKYDSILIVGKNEDSITIWQSIEQGFSKFYRTLTYINGSVTEVSAWEKQEVGIPRLKNKDMSELTKPGIYLLDHDTTTDNLREGSTIAISYFDYFIVVRQWTDTTMLQYSWDNTMTSAYWRMLHLDEEGKAYSATEWSITKEGLPVIDKGDYADVTQEGLYLVKGNSITDRLSMIAGTLNTNHNKFMYVSKSSGSAAPNIKQTIIDGFDMYVRVVYLDSSGNAFRSDGWEKRSIGEGSSGGSANIYIGEEAPTDGSNVWIDSDSFNAVGTEVVDSLEGNESLKAPSVRAVNTLKNNINEELSSLITNINKAKKVVLTGQWINAVAAFGGGTMLTLPIYNPTGAKPDVSGITGQFYDESATAWKDITTIQVGWATASFIVLTLNTTVQKYGVLVRLYGTIQAQ